MRVLHAAVSLNPSSGVVHQLESEARAAHELDISWTVSLSTPKDIRSPVVFRMGTGCTTLLQYPTLKLAFYSWLHSVAPSYDIILLRHAVHDILEARAIASLSKVWTVHHTLEVPELLGEGRLLPRIRGVGEALIGTRCLQRCRGIVAVTPEIARYELDRSRGAIPKARVLVSPNGISYDEPCIADRRTGEVAVLFVAHSFEPWHGVDLLIEAASRSDARVVIHLAGALAPAIAAAARKDVRFRVHGVLNPNAIGKLAEHCWIGLSSLALHRNSMVEACPLKSREYLRMGLPVYGSYRDPGLPQDFPFYRQGAIDLAVIRDYAESVRMVPRSEVALCAQPWIDKTRIIERLYSDLRCAEAM
jgi:glycosyltransferase involved in cell wall biosynthesis